MPYPPEIALVACTVGGASALESGTQLVLSAEITSSRGLMWGATGWQYPSITRTITGTEGAELSFSLPATDLAGWRLLDDSGSTIDVSAPGSYTHTYTIRLTTLLSGRPVGQRTIGPFVLPAGSGPVDLDTLLPVGTVAGGVVLVPDTWGPLVEAAEAAAADAAANLAAAEGRYLARSKLLDGGQVPEPLRVPHLVIEDTYPNAAFNHRVVWAEPGGRMYGVERGGGFLASTDHGKTWTYRTKLAAEIGTQGIFLRLATGTLLAYQIASPPVIMRSTDDGATWTTTHTLRASTVIMGPGAWAEDQSGHIYYGEYQVVDSFAEINVYRSTDDGGSFAVFHAFPGPATADEARVRHVHGVQYDSVSQRVYVATGDSEAAAGIYRTNATASATALERVVDNSQLTAMGATLARAIGIMFFPTHLAWGVDATVSPYLVRMARDQIGVSAPTAEIVYRLNGTSWWSTRAASDGSAWLFSTSKEGAPAIDNLIHLQAVEDNGATVWEMASAPQYTAGATGSIAPVGKPEMHGDRMWLQGFNLFHEDGTARRLQFAARLGRGLTALPIAARDPNPVLAWQSITSGPLVISTPQTIAIGQTRAGSLRKRLLIHDWCVRRTAGSGTAKIQLYNLTTSAVVWESTVTGTIGSQRSTLGRDDAYWIEAVDIPTSSSALEVRVVVAAEFTGNVQLTYAWGIIPA